MTISLDTSKYIAPTKEQIEAAKAFVRQREDFAALLQGRVDEVLAEAAQSVVEICYRYGIDPKRFVISSDYNEEMMSEIADLMDNTEQEILDLIYEYSTRVTDDRDHIGMLAAWVALLGRGERNLMETLDEYLYKTLRDWEAAIAAMGAAKLPVAKAVTRIKTFLHQIYNIPEFKAAFKHWQDFAATYIRSRGIQYGAVGRSNNGSTNVVNMAKRTLQLAWMHELYNEYEESGAIGYLVLRGSDYHCDWCQDVVDAGVHPMDDYESFPPQHPSCACWVLPVYEKE